MKFLEESGNWSIAINGKNAKTYWDLTTYQNFFMKTIFYNYMKCLQIFLKYSSRLQVFQYNLLNNVLYLIKMLFKFGEIDSPLCHFTSFIIA